jgi:complex III assembly factor LYRM7
MSSALASKARVFAGYRRMFRARKSLFSGDIQAMVESRVAIKQEFAKNATASGADHIEGLLSMVDEAVDMLTHGIVRGNLNQDSGNYGTYLFAFR